MRIVIGSLICLVTAFTAPVALALDGTESPATAAMTPLQAFRLGARAYKAGEMDKAVNELRFAADKGHPGAQWKLGRMYAEGDGVPHDDLKAFQWFARIVDSHGDEMPGSPQASFVASAFVSLANYHLDGIPNSDIKANPERARELYSHAASYFGDPEAQYQLGRLYMEGIGCEKNARMAARWLSLAATKGQHQAQALLGHMLFTGKELPRQGARGLMLLTLARDGATGPEDAWIGKMQEQANTQASEIEREAALVLINNWLKGRRD